MHCNVSLNWYYSIERQSNERIQWIKWAARHLFKKSSSSFGAKASVLVPLAGRSCGSIVLRWIPSTNRSSPQCNAYHAALILWYATLCLILVVHNLSTHFSFKNRYVEYEESPPDPVGYQTGPVNVNFLNKYIQTFIGVDEKKLFGLWSTLVLCPGPKLIIVAYLHF